MSEELIRRRDAIKALDANFTIKGKENMQTVLNYLELVRTRIEGAPSTDPKQGEWLEWIDCEGEVFWKCSACGQASEASVAGILYKFCPFCGADMRKGADDE